MSAKVPGSAGRIGERLLTGLECAGRLGCSVESLRRWRESGILADGVYHRKGQRWVRYDYQLVLAQLQERGLK